MSGRSTPLEQLQRDLAIMLDVVREVHGGHATRAELTLDQIPSGEGAGCRSATSFVATSGIETESPRRRARMSPRPTAAELVRIMTHWPSGDSNPSAMLCDVPVQRGQSIDSVYFCLIWTVQSSGISICRHLIHPFLPSEDSAQRLSETWERTLYSSHDTTNFCPTAIVDGAMALRRGGTRPSGSGGAE